MYELRLGCNKQKTQSRIYSYSIIYSYTVNVNLMLICIELSELIVNMSENSNILYLSML